MTKKPKLETVAKEAGVSVATASQVMRGTGRISEATRKKVLKTAKKLNYVPDGRAASMRSGENREIGLSIHKIANPFNAEVISGASDLLESKGYLLSVLDAQDDHERQRKHLEAFIRSRRGGVIWVPAEDTPKSTFDMLRTHRLPSVTFLRRAEDSSFDHVGIENAEAISEAVHHLADLGHKNIAYLGGIARFGALHERFQGYKQTMNELGLGPVIDWACEDGRSSGMEAFKEMRKAHPEVTAVVCNGDMVAIGACLALQRMGEIPGKDFSVVGFDDIKDAELASPPLTTVAVSPYDIGRKLGRAMLERIGEVDMPATVSLVPGKLVVRSTTGAVPK